METSLLTNAWPDQQRQPFLTSLLSVVLPVTIILDITWASLYGPYLGTLAIDSGVLLIPRRAEQGGRRLGPGLFTP